MNMNQEQMIKLAEKVKNQAWSNFWEAKNGEVNSYEEVKELEAEYNTAFNLVFFLKYPALARFQGGAQ